MIRWEKNIQFLKLGLNKIPVIKEDDSPARVSATVSGTTHRSKSRYPNRAIKSSTSGDFYAKTQYLEWAENDRTPRYVEVKVFQQDPEYKLTCEGKLTFLAGSSDVSSPRADFFIIPQNVEDIEKYIADTVEDDLDANIFSEEAKVPDIDTVELNVYDKDGNLVPNTSEAIWQSTALRDAGSLNFISTVAHFRVSKLPSQPCFKLKLPFVNGSLPAVLNSYLEQRWWIPNPDTGKLYEVPQDNKSDNYRKDASDMAKAYAKSIMPSDITASHSMVNGDNVLLMGNSNEVKLPLTYNHNWLSANDSLIWSYPLDTIDMDNDRLCIQEELSGNKGYIVDTTTDEETLDAKVVEVDGMKAIDFNRQFFFHFEKPFFAVPGQTEYSVSFWYHKTNDWTVSYNGFALGLYVNNRYWMRIQPYGRSYRHYFLLGGINNSSDAYYFGQSTSVDSGQSGWFLYTFTRSTITAQTRYYINDILVQTVPDRQTPFYQVNHLMNYLRIGTDSTSKRSNFKGHLRNFRGYNKALSHDEVKALYNESSMPLSNIMGDIKLTLSGLSHKA
jgi:hypothetical protein